MEETLRALEALLFASSKPLNLRDIASHLSPYFEGFKAEESLQKLKALYQKQKRAFRVGEAAGGYLLETTPDVSTYIISLRGAKEKRLSKGAMEVLSIIAFKQPITRPEIDAIRGMDSKSHIENLLESEWIATQGKKETPGRPSLFATTEKFLLHFGLPSIEDFLSKQSSIKF